MSRIVVYLACLVQINLNINVHKIKNQRVIDYEEVKYCVVGRYPQRRSKTILRY